MSVEALRRTEGVLLCDVQDGICTVTINRPEQRN